MLPSPPIDRDWLLGNCSDSVDFALSQLNEFATTCPSRFKDFETALTDHSRASISSRAHALKGVAGILAAGTLMEFCSNLESTSDNDDWNSTRDLIQQLRDETQRVIDFIPSVRDTAADNVIRLP